MDFSWKIVIDAGVISSALLAATLLRARFRFFQRFMIPNAITAGFLLLPLFNYIFPLAGYDTNRLGELVYHLLSISFIAMILRSKPPKQAHARGTVLGMAAVTLSQYAMQALVGLMLTFLLLSTAFPDLSPAFGLFLPLGFSLGPGQAYAIGRAWEAWGFAGAGTVGLTFAAIGYLWACFVGVLLINYGIKKGWLQQQSVTAFHDKGMLTGVVSRGQDRKVGASLSTDSEAIDSFSLHAAAVAATYFLSFLFLQLLSWGLGFAGEAGQELAANLWGINFIFSAFTAYVVRWLLTAFRVIHVLDDETLSRISGFAVDYMVAGAIAAISLVFVGQYWLEILSISIAGGLLTTLTIPWMASRAFKDHHFERMIMLYGASSGTITTGLALLRILDPEYRTSVAPDYMLSAGLTFLLAIPFVLSINLPAKAGQTGNMGLFWLMIAISAAYLLVSFSIYLVVARRGGISRPGRWWYVAADESADLLDAE